MPKHAFRYGTEIFVHVSGLLESVRKGDEVTYEIKEGKKGEVAHRVQWVNSVSPDLV